MMRLFCHAGICFILICFIYGCRRNFQPEIQSYSSDTILISDTVTPKNHTHVISKKITPREKPVDTIWMHSVSSQKWYDTISGKNFEVAITAWIDTNDHIIDTIKSNLIYSIAIGYNHYYSLHFSKNKKYWFSLNFNKKNDLYSLLYGTDLWLDSNLDIIHNIIYNDKFDRFVVELSVKAGTQFNSMYYLIAPSKDEVRYVGTISSWGGGDPDGAPFLTENGKMYVTCGEIYNFEKNISISISDYAAMSLMLSGKTTTSSFGQLHGLRYLSNNYFLVVFARYHNKPKYNALILSTDSTLIDRFGYFGLIEDIDAVLLFEDLKELNTVFLFDTEREVLVSIHTDSVPRVKETGLYEMVRLQNDKIAKENYFYLNFGFYGSYEFYYSPIDSVIYYRKEKFQ